MAMDSQAQWPHALQLEVIPTTTPLLPERPHQGTKLSLIGCASVMAAALLFLTMGPASSAQYVIPAAPTLSTRTWASRFAFGPSQRPATAPSMPAWRSSGMSLAAEQEGGIAGENEHKVTSMPKLTEEQLQMRQALQAHQKEAARLSNAEQARNLMHYGTGYGVLSTNSIKQPGYPAGSVVLFAADDQGRPVFSFSAMSTHTHDLLKDPKASFVVSVENFKGIEDGRITFIGDIHKVPDADVEALRALYKAKHPSAFWVDFLGDLSWWRMDDIQAIRFVWGFANAGAIEPSDYAAAQPDPIAAFSKAVVTHMNEDHADANRAIVNHYVPIKVDSANIIGLDRLGMDMQVTKDGASFKLRVPFVREAKDRKAVKEILVEMTRAGAAAAQAAPAN